MDKQYCGYIALVGRPNVGKSTLLNKLLGQKISITSNKPQTTRHRILGIDTLDTHHQLVYVDTPGIHSEQKKALNRYMNKEADNAIYDVDVVVLLLDGLKFKEDDEFIIEKLKEVDVPIVLAINKVDKIKDKDKLLPFIEKIKSQLTFKHIIPLSAKTGNHVDTLQQVLCELMPEGPYLFTDSQVTNRSVRFMAAEMIREKIFRTCGEELPYSVTVDIEKFEVSEKLCRIAALILLEKEGHKRIIIGSKGEKLKQVGKEARLDMERMLEKKVFLELWCKVKSGWSDDERLLQSLGYDDFT